MRRCQKTLLFLQVFLNFDLLVVLGLCPFLQKVLEIVVYGCDVVCLILNIFLWIVDLYLGYGQ